jgi:uncharacterized membrane protein YphA (DoxX/SURF4 family)
MPRGYRIGLVAVAMLVVLRLAIGWHFLYEGSWKRNHPGFSAEGFFRQSRGPLAQDFKDEILADDGGVERLKASATKDVLLGMVEPWDDYLRAAVAHYGFSTDQEAAARAVQKRYEGRANAWYVENQADIDNYLAHWHSLAEERQKPGADDVPFIRQRLADREAALRAQAGPWLDALAKLDAEYQHELDQLVGEDQRERGPVPCESTTLELVDRWTWLFLMVVGGCLIAGLFSRLNAVAGAAFLAMIVASHLSYPGVWPEPHPSEGHSLLINKDAIEMLALLALAATPVGRWGGLDFFIHYGLTRHIFRRRRPAAVDDDSPAGLASSTRRSSEGETSPARGIRTTPASRS